MTVFPYNGTSGWSGSDTSRARARYLDESGITSQTQQRILHHLHTQGTLGSTWKEMAEALNEDHGTISGSLSNLHKAHHVARLTETRDRCKVYVHPNFIHGRRTEHQGRNRLTDDEIVELHRIDDDYDDPDIRYLLELIWRLV